MKPYVRILLSAIVALALIACASAGKKFDRTHVNDIKKGVHTKAQIREWFGEPYQVTAPLQGHPAGCMERWTYVHAYSSYGEGQKPLVPHWSWILTATAKSAIIPTRRQNNKESI